MTKQKNKQKPTVFVSQNNKYVCDTCEPLKDAIQRRTIEWVGIKRGLYPGELFKSTELENLRLLAYWNAKKQQDWALPFHRNEGLEIAFVENGTADFSIDKQKNNFAKINQKNVVVTKPWQEHAIGNPTLSACKMYFAIIDFGVRKPNQEWKWPSWILLSKKDRTDFANYLRKTDIAIFKSTPTLKAAFTDIGKILSAKNDTNISRLAFLLNIVIFELLDIFRSDKTDYSNASTSENVVRYFLEQLPNYCAEPWTIETMAEDCGLKSTRFSYYCKQLTNLSPIEILNDVRLKRAMDMIKDASENKTLLDICLDCGFSSSQYFSTSFKRKYGKPPSFFFNKK